MVVLSPYLNSSPNELAYLLGQVDLGYQHVGEAACEIVLIVDGRFAYSTGIIRVSSLDHLEELVKFYYRRGASVKLELRFSAERSYFNPRNWIVVPLKVAFSAPINGVSKVSVSGKAILSSSAMRTARTRAAKSASAARRIVSPVRVPGGRLNPEIIVKPFLRTFEIVNSGPYQIDQDVVPTYAYYRIWSGVQTPNFRRLKPGQYPDNPHTVVILEQPVNRYYRHSVSGIVPGDFSTEIRPFHEIYDIPGLPVHNESADFKALQNLINKAQLGIQANFAQNFAQIGQMTSLIAGNATKILKSLRQLKRGNIPGAITALGAGRKPSNYGGSGLSVTKSLASNWLQLQYGWKPLLSDIQGLLKILPNLSSPAGFVQRVSASGTVKSESVTAYPPGNAIIGFDRPGKTTVVSRTTTKYTIRYRLSDPYSQFLAQTGFSNPINTLWEIIPFSFVFDWFVPVGAYLESLTAFNGLTFLGGSKVVFTRERADSAINYAGPVSGVPQSTIILAASFRRETVALTRSALSGFPSSVSPSLTPNPFANSGLVAGTNNRASNAIALLAQFYRGGG